MSDKSLKLQQRAQLISVLNKYRDINSINNSQLYQDIEEIIKIEDKTLIVKILFQEILSSDNVFYQDACSIIALEAVDSDTFEKEAINVLNDKKVSDDKKFIVASLMRQKGLDFEYRDITNYIENPQELAHSGVKNFLTNAIFDAEVQIDLLDFFINIPKEEKLYFLDNLKEEYDPDNVANAFSLLIQLPKIEKDEAEFLQDGLLNIDSPYTLKGLNYALEFIKNDTKTKNKIKKKVKMLSFKYPKFKDIDLIKSSKAADCYIGFVDGNFNFPLVLTRQKDNNNLDILLMTINTIVGMTSCVGFCEVNCENYKSIIKRLFNDSAPIKISSIALKSLYKYYSDKSIKNNIELPYELIVWKNFLNDIRIINYDLSEFINSKLDIIPLTDLKVKKFASSFLCETWFYPYGQDKKIDNIIDIIETTHSENLDEINRIVKNAIDNEFLKDKDFIKEFNSRLLMQSYVAKLAKLKMTSSCAYSICFQKKYLKMLLNSIIDKSLYFYFNTKLKDIEENNRFKKNKKTNFSKDELQLLLTELEEKWN